MALPYVQEFHERVKKSSEKNPTKPLKIKTSAGLPQAKRKNKAEEENDEKTGIELNEKYDKLSKMIIFSNAGK